MAYLLVFVGAGIGGVLRHAVTSGAARAFGAGFPVGTLAINVLGSLLIGVLAGYYGLRGGTDENLRLFLGVGILGGFTTFSAFSLDTMLLMQRHQPGAAAAYVALSVLLALGGVYAGMALPRLS
jgi:CrcB protein